MVTHTLSVCHEASCSTLTYEVIKLRVLCELIGTDLGIAAGTLVVPVHTLTYATFTEPMTAWRGASGPQLTHAHWAVQVLRDAA